jgi:hypothetical protein
MLIDQLAAEPVSVDPAWVIPRFLREVRENRSARAASSCRAAMTASTR